MVINLSEKWFLPRGGSQDFSERSQGDLTREETKSSASQVTEISFIKPVYKTKVTLICSILL